MRRCENIASISFCPSGSPEIQPGFDFYSRYFAPWKGIPEDPVTGLTYKTHEIHIKCFGYKCNTIHNKWSPLVSLQAPPTLCLVVTGPRNWGRLNCWVIHPVGHQSCFVHSVTDSNFLCSSPELRSRWGIETAAER